MSDILYNVLLRHYRGLLSDLERQQSEEDEEEEENDTLSLAPLRPTSPDVLTQAMVNALKIAKVRPTTFGSNG